MRKERKEVNISLLKTPELNTRIHPEKQIEEIPFDCLRRSTLLRKRPSYKVINFLKYADISREMK